jgi:uracil-DNA glycosylase
MKNINFICYPPKDPFSALITAVLIKVVIIGQDPYHGREANGLAFSVNDGIRITTVVA